MFKPNWQNVVTVKIPADSQALWTLAWDYISGPKKLKLTVSEKTLTKPDGTQEKKAQEWRYASSPVRECTANGDLNSTIDPAKCLCTSAPVGALIAKIGGSTADRVSSQVFPVGVLCILDLKDTDKGPLFLTINDEATGFSDNAGAIEVLIQEAL